MAEEHRFSLEQMEWTGGGAGNGRSAGDFGYVRYSYAFGWLAGKRRDEFVIIKGSRDERQHSRTTHSGNGRRDPPENRDDRGESDQVCVGMVRPGLRRADRGRQVLILLVMESCRVLVTRRYESSAAGSLLIRWPEGSGLTEGKGREKAG